MIVDVVVWNDLDGVCNRCGRTHHYYITPYWDRAHQVCPLCCVELQRFYDQMGWPKDER